MIEPEKAKKNELTIEKLLIKLGKELEFMYLFS